jgi:Double zinc ribbon
MGLFSDKCEKCGNRIKKRARFCGKCGEPAPGSWVKCFKCKKWLGSESEYCPHCKTKQHRGEREILENCVVPLQYGLLIQRIDVDTVRSRLDKTQTITIEEGYSAIIMVDGEVKDVIGPGVYNTTESLWKRFFSGNHSTSLFVVDAGEIVFPYANRKLRSKEDMELNLYAEVIVQFDPRHAKNMIANMMRGKRQLYNDPAFDAAEDSAFSIARSAESATPLNTNLADDTLQLGFSAFWKYFKSDFHNTTKKLCSDTGIDDIIRNPDTRFNFENELTSQFERTGISCGMRLVRVTAVDFFGPDYEKLREHAAEVEFETRRLTLERRAREALLENQKFELDSDQELNLYIDRLTVEYGIESETRVHELDDLRLDLANKLNLKTQKYDQELQRNESDFNREDDAKQVDHDLAQDVKKHDTELSKTTDWLQIKELKSEQKIKEKVNLLQSLAGYSDVELAAVLPPEQVQLVIQIRKQQNTAKLEEQIANLSPEQILALKAAESPEAAKAVAEIAKSKVEIEASRVKAEMSEKANEQMERVLDKSLDANAKVAANNQTFIKNN